ncbi:MAG: adenine-specific methyltransferase EcoRI family protein [Selenomonadaceae bacterium]|nr:adenine-specific methyltransferase EcoRI family protein [Selenomonadaceae bacterium]
MAGNRNLNAASRAKKDEFYTQIRDIENEMYHYQHHFKDKVVLCNCDDPYESDFFKYFMIYFNQLGLRKVIATCYAGSPIVQTELDFFGTQNYNPHFDKRTQAIKLEVTEVTDLNGDGAADLADVKLLLENNRNVVTYLEGNGDFRSPECVDALKEADIVVTNPPFSLFREYVAQLVAHDKKFLIIGNKNAITYKEIFPLIKDNKMWTGYRPWSGGMWFISTAEDFDKVVDGKKLKNAAAVWFTNLDVRKRHEDILLFKRYAEEPELFPRYDNYDAIEVSKTAFIPCDYFGVMGVPITFLDKYNPAQFEIVGNAGSYGVDGYSLCPALYIGGKKIYKRILIRRRRND